MNANNSRSSNIELLRIISLLMIIAGHLSVIGIMHTSYGEPYQIWAQGSISNKIITSLLTPGGDTGVGIFFIITGFFLAASHKRRSLAGIVCPVIFYAAFTTVVHIILCRAFNVDLGLMSTIKLMLNPITGTNWWFATSYCALIIVSPMLNSTIEAMPKKKLLILIAVIWIIWYVLGYGFQVSFWGIERAVFYYMIGAFIRLYTKNLKQVHILFSAMIFLVSWLCYTLCTYYIGSSVGGGINLPEILMNDSVVNILKMVRAVVFSPICAISLFIIFKSIDFHSNNIINFISSLTFGVYLIHESPINRQILWTNILCADTKQYQSELLPLTAIISVILIFVVCAAIDFLYKKTLYDWMKAKYNSIIEFFLTK